MSDIPGPPPSVDQLMELLAQDKKVKRGMLTFILVRGIGAAFIDPACLLIRAIVTGHDAEQAEALAARCPGWPWKLAVARAARNWASHRRADRAVG